MKIMQYREINLDPWKLKKQNISKMLHLMHRPLGIKRNYACIQLWLTHSIITIKPNRALCD